MTTPRIRKEVEKEAKVDLASQIAGVLSAAIPVFTILGFQFEWLTREFVESVYVLIVAVISLGVTSFTIYKNHFSGKKAKREKEVLKERGLK